MFFKKRVYVPRYIEYPKFQEIAERKGLEIIVMRRHRIDIYVKGIIVYLYYFNQRRAIFADDIDSTNQKAFIDLLKQIDEETQEYFDNEHKRKNSLVAEVLDKND